MTLVARFRRWLLDICVPPIVIPGAKGTAFFSYASHKAIVVDGRAVCPVLDPLLSARDRATYTHVVVGRVPRPEAMPGVQLPHRLSLLQFAVSLIFIRRGDTRNYRFIDLLYTSVLCRPYSWRRLHVLRTFLIAHYFSLKFRALAEACDGVYVICYYDATMLGVVWAFRQTGKPVVDIQHGHLGPTHDAYCNRAAFQLDSDLQPTSFLVWAPKFGRFLEETLGAAWQSTDYLHLKALAPQSVQARSDVTILYTLQDSTVFPQEVADAIRQWPALKWVFRRHPSQPRLPVELDWLRALPNCSVVGSEEALPIALYGCDLHITYNSSAVHEAAAIGKESFHMDPALADRFQSETEEGLARFVPAERLVAELDEFLSRRGGAPGLRSTELRPSEAVRAS